MDKTYTRNDNKNLILPLQGLRAIAFIGIFLSHTEYKVFSPLGGWGVSVFLILSGFLMIINYCNGDKLTTPGCLSNVRFAVKKIGKLYPLHIAMLFSAILLVVLVKGSIKDILIKAIVNCTLLQSYVPYQKIYYSFNAVSWYLSVMFFVYFCFPWILQVCEKIKSKRMAVVGIIALFIVQIIICITADRIEMPYDIGFTKWMMYICPPIRLIDFAIGCMFGVIYTKVESESHNDWILQLAYIFMVYACFVYIVVIIYSLGVENREYWWCYSVVYTVSNGLLIYCISRVYKKSFIARIFSFNGLVWLGNISAYAFLIHQMVIRYITFVNNVCLFKNPLVVFSIKVILPFIITLLLCFAWKKISKILKMMIMKRKEKIHYLEEA